MWTVLGLICLGAVGFVGTRHTAVDYPVYVIAAQGFLRGEDVYAWQPADYARAAADLGFARYESPYRYPPLTALLVAPLLAAPHGGLWLWSGLQTAAWLLAARILGGLASDPCRRRLIWVAGGLLTPFFVSLYAGQVNPLVTLLVVAAVVTAGRDRATLGGILLGLSLMLKPLGAAVAALTVWAGRWPAVAGTIAGAALGLGLPVAVFGPRAFSLGGSGLSAVAPAYPPAQSLPGLAARWLTGHPYGFSLVNDPDAARWVSLLLSAGVLAATFAACWPVGRDGQWFQLRAGLITVAVLLANPATWYHHGTMLSIPLAVLIGRAGHRPVGWWAALGVSYGLVQIWGFAWHAFVGFTPLLDLATWGMVGLWVLLLLETRHKP